MKPIHLYVAHDNYFGFVIWGHCRPGSTRPFQYELSPGLSRFKTLTAARRYARKCAFMEGPTEFDCRSSRRRDQDLLQQRPLTLSN